MEKDFNILNYFKSLNEGIENCTLWFDEKNRTKAKLLLEASFFIIIFTYLKLIQVENGQGVTSLLDMGIVC